MTFQTNNVSKIIPFEHITIRKIEILQTDGRKLCILQLDIRKKNVAPNPDNQNS
jgi:hypothetical protein